MSNNSQNKNYTLPWIEKYRPTSLSNIMSQNKIIKNLKICITKKCLPHLLFYGPPGCGKTSTILACAKKIYGKYVKFMVMELNASDNRGIDVVRTTIKRFVNTSNIIISEVYLFLKNLHKLVISDEADAMTNDAQAILRRIVEEFTRTTRFCLICNNLQKINPALQSRCSIFRFSPISHKYIKKKIKMISDKENFKINSSGINALIDRSGGDMRKVLTNLQSISTRYNIINEKNINICLGYPQKEHMCTIIKSLLDDTFTMAFDNINKLKRKYELSLNDIILEIHKIIISYILTDNISKLSIPQMQYILSNMKNIERSQSVNTLEDISLGTLVGIFKLALNLKS